MLMLAGTCLLTLGHLQAATVRFLQIAVDDNTGATIGAVNSDTFQETAAAYSTVTAPVSSGSYRFTRWTNSSYPAETYRDAWGRSQNPTSFVLLEDTTCTAHYLPTTLDSDNDGIPDWFEIEYFGDLDETAASDFDGDSITLAAEYNGGTHPLYANASQAGGIAYADSGMVTVNLGGFSRYTLRSEPAGTVNVTAVVETGTVVTTPDLSGNSGFGYWTLDGVAQRDAWGRSLPQLTFTIAEDDREAISYLFVGDSDGDGVADAFEQKYYGTLANGANYDGDGDGITLLAEANGGTNPLYANETQAGGVSWADSAMVSVNLAGFSSYTIASSPAGTVDESATVPDGTMITTPNMTAPSFGYWTLDGIVQRDEWGVALRQFTFLVDGTDRAAVAYFFNGDSDGDGVNDGFEYYYFGSLANNATSDIDGDGQSLLQEYTTGSNPLFANIHQDGGVSWADSDMVLVNLQFFEQLGKLLINGILQDFFSPDPNSVTGIQAGTWSSTAASDWDNDGDFDLFIAHESGLRVFRNIGSANNPNFQEITNGFTLLEAFITSITKPQIAGGDWNGDGFGDLVVGGSTGTLRLIPSDGSFSANESGPELTFSSTRTSPALGDMDGDGLDDLLVLLDDGTVTLFTNNGTATPFSGSGTPNFLGVAAPNGLSITTGDINQDGIRDVLLTDSDGRIWEFHHDGAGNFSLQSKVWGGSYAGYASGLSITAVDIEGDGDLDVIGGLANGGIHALRAPSIGRPTGLIAAPGADSIQLDWNADWQSRIRGYHVYRGTSSEGPWSKLTGDYVPLPSYLDNNPDPAVPSYYYHVTGLSYFSLPGSSQPSIVESLPSDIATTTAGKVVLSVRPVIGKAGKRIKLSLSIENAVGVSGTGMELRIAYDSAKLLPWTQASPDDETVLSTGLSRNLFFTDNGSSASGELVIDGSGGQLEPGSGKLFTLQFEVDSSVPNGTPLDISITSGTMNDLVGNPLMLDIVSMDPPQSGDTYFLGDIDGNGGVTEADKDLLKDLIKPDSRTSTAEEHLAGDFNGDGKLSSKDLVLLMQLLENPSP
jgi:hypothetical protein